jgi:hypothetical protein
MIDFPEGCQFPSGDPQTNDFYFCGEPKAIGYSYCPHHCGIAYEKPKKRFVVPFIVGMQLSLFNGGTANG